MELRAVDTFLDGRDRHEAGSVFDEPDEAKARYFVDNGWAESDTYTRPESAPTGGVSLDVQNGGVSGG